MGNDKLTLPKSTSTNLTQATLVTTKPLVETKLPISPTIQVKPEQSTKAENETVKNVSTVLNMVSPNETSTEIKTAINVDDKKSSLIPKSEPAQPTKMDIATEIFIRMKKNKSTTRKEIVDQFMIDAKLSKAGASTYYQLIKAKLK